MNIDNILFALTIFFFVTTLLIANFRLRKMKRSEGE